MQRGLKGNYDVGVLPPYCLRLNAKRIESYNMETLKNAISKVSMQRGLKGMEDGSEQITLFSVSMQRGLKGCCDGEPEAHGEVSMQRGLKDTTSLAGAYTVSVTSQCKED